MRGFVISALTALLVFSGVVEASQLQSGSKVLTDPVRGRDVPVQLYFPAAEHSCVESRSCPVALISPGYGLPHTSYTFLAAVFAARGYLVVAIQHDLPADPPLTGDGDIVQVRTPAWRRGAVNIKFVRGELSRTHHEYDWSAVTLVGHSNGGDISAYLLAEAPHFAQQLVTLDHRRVPLPRDFSLRVLSIRGSDFEADRGVLPSMSEQAMSGTCVVGIPGSRHNDMHDEGPSDLKAQITSVVGRFLENRGCGA